MHDAVELVVEWAFAQGAPDVYWECYAGNTASASVARRAGFAYTGSGPALIPGRGGAPTTAWKGLRRADGAPASNLTGPNFTRIDRRVDFGDLGLPQLGGRGKRCGIGRRLQPPWP